MKIFKSTLYSLTLLFAACATNSQAAVNTTPITVGNYAKPIRVTCVGDSITNGGYPNASGTDYPAQLGSMLGKMWTVFNWGRSGTTALKKGDNPYSIFPEYAKAIDSNPDVVIMQWGANDTKPQNWMHSTDFKNDYRWLIHQFKALPSHPRIFICRPCFATAAGSYGISETNLRQVRIWMDQLADEESTGLIDNYAVTQPYPGDLPDGVHPNARAYGRIAENTFHALTGKSFPGNIFVRATATKIGLGWYTYGASTAYAVGRSTVRGGPYTSVSSNNTAGAYNDASVTVNNTYYYSLSTTNVYGTAVTSPEIAVALTPESGLLNRTSGGTPTASAAVSGKAATQGCDGADTTDWFTGNTGGTGWIQYDYGPFTNWAITSYRLVSSSSGAASDPSAWQFQGSMNGATWNALDTRTAQTFSARRQAKRYLITNTVAYRYYRLNVTSTQGGGSGIALAEFQLWNEDTEPVTSADGEPVGAIAAYAFDGFTTTKWYNNINGGTGFLRYQYGGGVARTLSGYKLTSANDVQERDPKAWQFQGSNDGTNWTTLDTQTGQVFANRYQTNTYAFTPTVPYRQYRLNVTANSGGSGYGIQLSEMAFIEASAPPRVSSQPAIPVVNSR